MGLKANAADEEAREKPSCRFRTGGAGPRLGGGEEATGEVLVCVGGSMLEAFAAQGRRGGSSGGRRGGPGVNDLVHDGAELQSLASSDKDELLGDRGVAGDEV